MSRRFMVSAAVVSAAAAAGFLQGRGERRPASNSVGHAQAASGAPTPAAMGTPRGARSQNPPKLTVRNHRDEEGRIELETTPGSPGYNPRKMIRVMGAWELFAVEPRLESWAPRVEQWLEAHIKEDFKNLLGLDAAGTVECRTATCRISIPREVNFAAARGLLETYYTPSASSADSAERAMYFVYGPGESGPHSKVPVGNPDASIAAMEHIRSVKLSSPACNKTPGNPNSCR